MLIGKDEILHLQTASESRVILEKLLNIYWRGLQEPLPFYVETSYTFVLHLLKGDMEKARQKTLESWLGGFYRTPEYDDVYLQFRYQDAKEALGKSFEDMSQQIFAPVFDHMETENG